MKRKPRVQKICQHCGGLYEAHAHRAATSKFCSITCKNDSERTRPRNDPRPCAICAKVFVPSRKHGSARFCSKQCIWRATKGPEFNARIAREYAEENGNRQRRTGKLSHTYVKFHGRHEHRVVAERKLGRSLIKGEIVHHIDGNPKNNNPSNLRVISQREHVWEHGLGLPGVTPKHRPWEKRRKGQEDACAKVCDEDVRRIREMALFGTKQSDIGLVFGLSQPHVSAIIRRERWGHVL